MRWIKGDNRDAIARSLGIGAGTVTEIIKAYRQNDSDFEQERE